MNEFFADLAPLGTLLMLPALGILGLVVAVNPVTLIMRVRRRRPEADSVLTASTPDLDKAMAALAAEEHASIAQLPYYVVVVADDSGVEVWGRAVFLTRFCRFPWSVLGRVETAQVDASVNKYYQAHLPGITVEVSTASGSSVRLPFASFATGPWGTGRRGWKRAGLWRDRIEARRPATPMA